MSSEADLKEKLIPEKPEETRKKDHNILFTKLSQLIKYINHLQKKQKKILKQNENNISKIDFSDPNLSLQTETCKEYITLNTDSNLLLGKIEKFQNYFQKKNQQYSLFQLLIKMTRKNYLVGGIYVSIDIGTSLLSSIVLNKITDVLKEYNKSSEIEAILLLLSIIALFFVKTFGQIKFDWTQIIWKAELKVTTQYLIFQKALKTKSYTSKQSDKLKGDAPDINNLMTVDIDELEQFYWSSHYLWTGIFEIIAVLLLLYQQLGDAIYLGLGVIGVALILNIAISMGIQYLFEKMMNCKDKRVALITDLIEGMKSIKYLNWERIFKEKIQEIRRKEFKILTVLRSLDGGLGIFWNSLRIVLMYLFLVNFVVNKDNDLKEANVFVIMLLFNLMTFPLGILPWSMGQIYKCRVSYNRINRFLQEKEIDSQEFIEDKDRLFDTFSSEKDGQNIEKLAIDIQNMKFQWPKRTQKKKQFKKGDQKKGGNKEEENQKEKEFQLKIENFKIKNNSLNFIIGPLGAGKSSLFQAILNEMDNIFKKNNSQQDEILDSETQSQKFTENEENLKLNTMIENNQYVKINGKIGLVTQNHWLQNLSIKENILFGKELDQEWYDTCIEASQLEHDLTQFSNRDNKLVGPQGNNLSGGQKQRISICRALYQDNDIYLFDDIFSSLDAHIAEKVYQKGIKDLLIKKKKKTVLMITSQYKSLIEELEQDKKEVNIIYMEQGTINNNQEQLNQFLFKNWEQQKKKMEEREKQKQQALFESSDIEEEGEDQQFSQKMKKKQKSRKKNKKDERSQDQEINLEEKEINISGQKDKIQLKSKESDSDDEEKLEKNEEFRDNGGISFRTLNTYFKACNWGLIINLVIFSILMVGTRIIVDFWLKSEVSDEDNSFEFLNKWFGDDFQKTYLFLILVNFGVTFVRMTIYVVAAQMAAYKLFNRLNHTIIFSNMKFFDKNPNGRIINRLSNDVLMVDDELPWFCHIFLEAFAELVCDPLAVAIEVPFMLIFFVVVFVLIYLLQSVFRASNREIKRLSPVNEGKLLTLLNETVKGLQVIRAFKKNSKILEDYRIRMNDALATKVLSQSVFIWLQARLLILSDILISGLCLLIITIILVKENFDYTSLVFALSYMIMVVDSFYNCIYNLCAVEQRMISVERMRQYYDQNIQEDLFKIEDISPEKLQLQKQVQENESQYSIIFDNVRLTYEEKDQNTEPVYALDGLNFKIKKGEKIAFVGRTGSGKTSILNVLFRMYEIENSGNIYVNGENIKYLALEDLRQKLSIIPQFGFLYNASFKDNLDPEKIYTEVELQKKIDETGLSIKKKSKKNEKSEEEDINNLKNDGDNAQQEQILNTENIQINKEGQNIEQNEDDKIQEKQEKIGLEFEIEDSGKNLSNGEKQIINFLRIILRDQNIVCLDEATSNMDPQTDHLLHEKLFEFTEDKTLLVITHRLENIQRFDKIVVMEKGKIVEFGHYDQLIQKEGGFFNRLIHK